MKEQYTFNCNISDINAHIYHWLYSDQLTNIIQTFKGDLPDTDSILERADWLLKFSDCWDYRTIQKNAHDQKTGEHARWQIDSTNISEEQKSAVNDGIHALGLIDIQTPIENNFDYIIALGGARFSCLYRTKYVHELLSRQKISAKSVVLLSGMRPILESERSSTDTYAPDARTEYDLINAGAKHAFGLLQNFKEEIYHNENPNKSWAVRAYDFLPDTPPIFSISAPSTESEKRRANSADTYKFFIEKLNVKQGSKLLLVTSQIYVPYQQIEAIRTLAIPYNLYIETVGFPVEWAGQQQGMMEPANYLQEIRSTIQAIHRYLHSIAI